MSAARKIRVDDTVVIGNVPLLTENVVAGLTSSSYIASPTDESLRKKEGQREGDIERTMRVVEQLCVSFGPLRHCAVIKDAQPETIKSKSGVATSSRISVECAFAESADAAAAIDNIHGIVLGGVVLSCKHKFVQ